MYDSYRFPIQRIDALKYFILRHFGGIYVDLDNVSGDEHRGILLFFNGRLPPQQLFANTTVLRDAPRASTP